MPITGYAPIVPKRNQSALVQPSTEDSSLRHVSECSKEKSRTSSRPNPLPRIYHSATIPPPKAKPTAGWRRPNPLPRNHRSLTRTATTSIGQSATSPNPLPRIHHSATRLRPKVFPMGRTVPIPYRGFITPLRGSSQLFLPSAMKVPLSPTSSHLLQ